MSHAGTAYLLLRRITTCYGCAATAAETCSALHTALPAMRCLQLTCSNQAALQLHVRLPSPSPQIHPAPSLPPLPRSIPSVSCSGYLWFFKIARLRLDPSAYSALRAGPEGTAIQ